MSRLRTCGTKIKHDKKEDALAHRSHLMRQGGNRLRVYRCKHCAFWHVGHFEHMGRRRR